MGEMFQHHYQLTVLPPFCSSIYHPLLFCPLFSLAPWLIHLPPCCIRPNTYFFHTLFIPLQKPLSHPSSSILISSCTAHCSQNTIPSVLYPILCFSMVFFVSPLNSLFWFCVFTVRFTFSHIPVFLFHPSSKTHCLVPTPSLICHFSLLLSTSPRLGLVHNHNFIAFPLKLCSHTQPPPPPVSDFCCH